MSRNALAVVGLLSLWGCASDRPVCLPSRLTGRPALRLSELGLFDDVPRQLPAPGVEPYRVQVSLFSDGAEKARYMALPSGQKLVYGDDRWTVPAGTYLVKTFSFPLDPRAPDAGVQRVETRVMLQTADGLVQGTYRWNAAQTDAECTSGNEEVALSGVDASGHARQASFHIPGTSSCQTCHEAGDRSQALGIRTRQLDVTRPGGSGPVNQIDDWVARGLVDRAPPEAERQHLSDPAGSGPLDARAQSYLDVTCGSCHTERGYARDTGVFFDLGHAPANLCRETAEVDGRDRVIVPGHPEDSELLARMRSSDPAVHMPRGPNHQLDEAGIALLASWIGALPPKTCPR